MTRAAALVLVEFREVVGAALSARYRGGRWFESTAAHQGFDLSEARSGLMRGAAKRSD